MILEGFDETLADLTKATVTIGVRAEEKVDEVANKVEASAKDFAPKGSRDHEGTDLAPSIETTGEGPFREVGPTARHGWFMENGTYKDAPQPYMGPALDKHDEELVSELGDVAGDI